MEFSSFPLFLLYLIVLPPVLSMVIFLIRLVTISLLSIYRLPGRSHAMGFMNSPFIYGDQAASVCSTTESLDDVLLSMHYGKQSVTLYRKSPVGERVECAFCLCGIEELQEVRELKCEHLFHRVCLDEWLRRRRATCPVCRRFLLSWEGSKGPAPCEVACSHG